jgi:hypothetical protein
MNIKNILKSTLSAIEKVRKPLLPIAAPMIYATAVVRPGISKEIITAEIISENAPLGIETGQMPDGGDNVVNAFVGNFVEKLVDAIKDDAKVECVIPPGSVSVVVNGANAGGPVVLRGTNINFAKGYGIIR